MPAPLEAFLHQYRSGLTSLTPEYYALYGGDNLLKEIQKYDPNAKWTDTTTGGGEGGEGTASKRLDFDITKLPGSKMPNGQSKSFYELAASNMSKGGLLNNKYKWDDPIYGNVTDSRNIKNDRNVFEQYGVPAAAMLIGMGGPALGGLLAAGGLGLGLGGTSAVTGGAAGLAAGNIPGAMGLGNSLGLSDSFLKLLGRAPQTVGRQISSGQFDMKSMAPMLLRLFGR